MDSFKGSLRADVACDAVRRGILDRLPSADVRCFPMADGGEGTTAAVTSALGGTFMPVKVTGPAPLMRVAAGYLRLPPSDDPRTAEPGGLETGSHTALVEAALACGLELLPVAARDPLRTTTFGVGELMAAAAAGGSGRIWLAVGGSATVDGGTGAASALGWRFLDGRGRRLPPGGGELERLARIEAPPAGSPELPPVTVLCDVDNPLLGDEGAAPVYGPQKGAGPEAVRKLERGLARLADVVERELGIDIRRTSGAGAAGGLGAGALAFFGADLVSGALAVMRLIGLEAALVEAGAAGDAWVVTGEGRLDEQSFRGKVVSGVTDLARRTGVSVAAIAGSSQLPPERAAARFDALEIASPTHGGPADEGTTGGGKPDGTIVEGGDPAARLVEAARRLAEKIGDQPVSPARPRGL